jgi:hypothetical protein
MLAGQIQLILLLTGLVTAGAVGLLLAPIPIMKSLFGEAPADLLSLLVVRHWGLLIGLVGGLLIFAAYHAEVRVPTLIVAIIEKVAFALGVFLSPFRRYRTALVVALADAGMATVYLMYLNGL